jgi:hypothetical protein
LAHLGKIRGRLCDECHKRVVPDRVDDNRGATFELGGYSIDAAAGRGMRHLQGGGGVRCQGIQFDRFIVTDDRVD